MPIRRSRSRLQAHLAAQDPPETNNHVSVSSNDSRHLEVSDPPIEVHPPLRVSGQTEHLSPPEGEGRYLNMRPQPTVIKGISWTLWCPTGYGAQKRACVLARTATGQEAGLVWFRGPGQWEAQLLELGSHRASNLDEALAWLAREGALVMGL